MFERKKQLESVNSNASHHKHEISTQNALKALKNIAKFKTAFYELKFESYTTSTLKFAPNMF